MRKDFGSDKVNLNLFLRCSNIRATAQSNFVCLHFYSYLYFAYDAECSLHFRVQHLTLNFFSMSSAWRRRHSSQSSTCHGGPEAHKSAEQESRK